MNTVLGALVAALIAIGTAAIALLTATEVETFADISAIQWTVLLIGGTLTFLKDYQAISSRRLINRVTGTGDGGGQV